jgi:predicted short-subunit dehydrogenase-like oxidoreductase (DUF2520 family)
MGLIYTWKAGKTNVKLAHIRSMKFSIVGTGNAAWHFTKMLLEADHTLLQVYARQPHKADEFVAWFGGEHATEPEELSTENDLVILAVSDQGIAEVAAKIAPEIKLAHTSGGTSLSVLPQHQRAVIWPLQSLTEGVDIHYKNMPICVQANDDDWQRELVRVFGGMSDKCFGVSEEQRVALHMAAVWANNFSNYMFRVAEQICKVHELPFHVLQPLIDETAQKIHTTSPLAAQTGPANRGDLSTIKRHLEMLRNNKELSDLYRSISEQIMNHRNGF